MKEKLSLLTELIKLASCDKEVRQREYDFILAIAERLGVSKKDFDPLFHEYIEFSPPTSEFERILQFHRLVLLMNVDQQPGTKELEFIKDLGIRMGLSPLATNKVLSEMTNYPNNMMPANRLIEIFSEQYN
jgi:hypothetical protein